MKIARLLLMLLTFSGLYAFGPPKTINEGYSIGDLAADFTLKNVDGEMISLSDYNEAKGFLVVFTCNSCPYANAYEERIIALDRKYKMSGVPVIAINPNNPKYRPEDSFENMQTRAKDKSYSFPYLMDEKQEVYPLYGAKRTPHCFLLEKTNSGNVVRYIGAIDDNYQDATEVEVSYVENAIDSMLEGGKISIEITKAIGCSIK